MQKGQSVFPFFFLFLFLSIISPALAYIPYSGVEEFSVAGSEQYLNYYYTGTSCFSKSWVNSYGGRSNEGVVLFNYTCEAYGNHTFYIYKDVIAYPTADTSMIQVDYYVSNTGNWQPLNRPHFDILDDTNGSVVYTTNLSTSQGWQTIYMAFGFAAGHNYKLIMNFTTWDGIPPGTEIGIDDIRMGTIAAGGSLSNPSTCIFNSTTYYFYPYDNEAMPGAIQNHIGNWSKVLSIWSYNGTDFKTYVPGAGGTMTDLSRGEIFTVITSGNSTYTLSNCAATSCGTYQSGVNYSWGFSGTSFAPGMIISKLGNSWPSVDVITGYNITDGVGKVGQRYTPNETYQELTYIGTGQLFNVKTVFGTNYTLGAQTHAPGTVCDSTDPSGRGYVSYTTCSADYGLCPSGLVCSPLTPQMNVTGPLIENYTSCGSYNILGMWVGCQNWCLPWTTQSSVPSSQDAPLYSNCFNAECRHCNKANRPASTIEPNTINVNNVTRISIPAYTVACINTTDGITNNIVIDNLGNVTTQGELTKKYNPDWQPLNTTVDCYDANGNLISCPATGGIPINTTSRCYDSVGNEISCGENSITSLGASVNSSLGTPYGTMVIAFLIAAGTSMFVFLNIKTKSIESFIVPFMLILAFFSLPGIEFFPTWFLLLQTVMVGLFIFFKVKGG